MTWRQDLAYVEPVGVDDLERASQAFTRDKCSTEICQAEMAAVSARRDYYDLAPSTDDNSFGLALSGGGIRSATFSLGVLQALAGHDLLKHVDFVSSVSGGGYTGTSLQWWCSSRSGRAFGLRPSEAEPPEDRFPYGTDDPRRWRDRAGQNDGPRLLRNLKEKGNYLTPGGGINLMSLFAVVLRSLILNLLFWVPLLTFTLLFVHWMGLYDSLLWLSGVGVGIIVLAALVYSVLTGLRVGRHRSYRFRRRTESYAGLILSLSLLFALIASIDRSFDFFHDRAANEEGGVAELFTGLGAATGGLVGGIVVFFRTMRGFVGKVRAVPGVTTSVVAVVASGLIIYGLLLFCHGLAVLFHGSDFRDYWPAFAAAFLLLSVCVNVNHISAHRMYRDRLMEAFMPGFRKARDGRSRMAPAAADTMKMDEVDVAKAPFPIINTNLLLVDSKERRRRLRGGDNFILTPCYCGSNATGWVDCRVLMGGGMTLPTAMAISGAAANPNTGAGGVGLTRNRVVSVLMAFLGLRLGYWIPAFRTGWIPFWLPNHVWPGIGAVLPLGHSEDSWFLELTDGGHFENLGIYELVRRRARLIIVCDGAQDPRFAFEDLQRAERRIHADFGARLELETEALERLVPKPTDHRFPEAELKLAEAGHALGRIVYADGSKGTLIYLKTTLIDGLPVPLLGYRGTNPTFPDQSTADQFFDEEQFEAYRELGFTIADRMLQDEELRLHIRCVLGPRVL